MTKHLPERIPACASNLLARSEWFEDPGVVSRARLREARGFARFISSERFAGTEIEAISLGHTINIRDPDAYDPHSITGLALLAHELKHVEQFEREGLVKFMVKYVWSYLSGGYGESVPFEAEAYQFQRKVKTHLEQEFEANTGLNHCREMADPHTPNEAFVMTVPENFQFVHAPDSLPAT